jgi:hypothetical protein
VIDTEGSLHTEGVSFWAPNPRLPAYVVVGVRLAAAEEPRALDVLVCEGLEVEVEPVAVNAAAVPTGAAAVAVAVAAAAVDVAATAAGVAVLGVEVERPGVVVGQSVVQLRG